MSKHRQHFTDHLIFKNPWEGPHHYHIIVRNVRTSGAFCGRRLRTVIDRCWTCDHSGKVLSGLAQDRV